MNLASGSTPGAPYDFTFRYDASSTPTSGRYALTLVSGNADGLSNFSSFTPYLQFAQAGAYTYLNFVLHRQESLGESTYAFFALGDNDGSISSGVLPTAITPTQYDFINASFEVYGRNGAYRNIVDSQSRGLTQVVSGVPEASTWAMMIAGFGAVGFAMRRRNRSAGAAVAAR
ncbi:PEP-CTERM sorting domain-containing protein [Sphingomonas piscis]|uniref:PEP-CTERM sorting domain-containing protein n=2 Tax=Sphingomonas piscis TaxID=2714943 RepID=A0A6G7YTF4_9SPHN|nr:PEP-CTERM sorting domain-containing protein [Sphingomonas piscis]